MNWVRVSVGITGDPRVYALADDLGIRPAEVVGLLVGVMTALPEHAPDGNLSAVSHTLLERWAGWDGERGTFAVRFSVRFLNDGVWTAWEKYNGSALRDAKSSAERAKAWRKGKKEERTALRTAFATPYGTENEPVANASTRRDETRRSTTTTSPSSEKPDDGGAARQSWVADACAIWAQYVSVMAYGEMGKRLKPLVAQYGPDLVLVALRAFCEWRSHRLGEEKVPGLPTFIRDFSAHVPVNRQHELRTPALAVAS